MGFLWFASPAAALAASYEGVSKLSLYRWRAQPAKD
jgi:hypothetical protein